MPSTEAVAARSRIWTLLIVSVGLFMVVLDNLIVSVALPSIHRDLGASMQSLEWTVNAYVLSYAVLLLTGAALGDRFGRKRMFISGILLFTAASAGSALAPDMGLLIATRALQGIGAAIVTPLTLTLLAGAFPPERRGIALGVWSGISGIAVALGPLVGGAVIQLSSWHWIFWINVPVGLALAPTAARRLQESYGPERGLDMVGLGLASTGLFGLIFGLIRAQTVGWTAVQVVVSLAAGIVLLVAFVAQELRAEDPMLPMSFFKRRSFAVTNVVSLSMYFGMFGSIFFMSQYLQNVLGNTPFEAGLKLLVWTGAIMVVSPAAGYFSERYGSRFFMVAGLTLQAVALGWLASEAKVGQSYVSMIVPFIFGGSGMALVFAPSASAVLASVRTDQAGQASGATNAIRELGGVLGIAVLSTIFSAHGSYASGQAFVDGLKPTMWVGAAVLAAGALAAVVFRFDSSAQRATATSPVPAGVSAPTAA
ncbi:MAG TPA: DHA2 family efflux MFS transporter permease subunit [Solirubrobacteraceae bacterium]|jgi:EmrB/QacA subfamily drug resistance transporter|nr:DHA2 family efflux MFS transporter permease subunit [Solirubrobacteraceae bacterium]